MKIYAIVPVKRFENAKTRLSSILTPDERVTLSSLMLEETLSVLAEMATVLTGTLVVSSDERARKLADSYGAVFLHEEADNGVNCAVSLGDDYAMNNGADATLVVPQDLPLLNFEEISALCRLAERDEKCVVICPSQRYDGTNLLLRKPPNVIPIFFDKNSYQSHVLAAEQRRVPVQVYSSDNLMLDIDNPDDVLQLLGRSAHDTGRVLDFLKRKDLKRTV
jgi:2-phospho-L-lactate guanylyltransferase